MRISMAVVVPLGPIAGTVVRTAVVEAVARRMRTRFPVRPVGTGMMTALPVMLGMVGCMRFGFPVVTLMPVAAVAGRR
jgi:hypothetical protein